MRVTVDRLLCESNGLCMGAAPEVFDLGADDELVIMQEEPAEALRAQVEEAVSLCPKQALSILGQIPKN